MSYQNKERKENNKIMVTFTTGAVVVLKTTHNSYVRAEPGKSATVNTQSFVGSYERFIIEPISGESGVYSLRTSHGTYLRASKGTSAKVDTQTYAGSLEKFSIEPAPNETGVYFIRTSHGTYLRASPDTSATVDTQTYAGPWEKFRINTIVDVGPSEEPSQIVSLPKPHMLVSSKPANHQDPAWNDTFDVAVIGGDLHVSRSDTCWGWGQKLALEAIENPKWTHTISVGPSSSNPKKVKLPSINMDVSPFPVNVQAPEWTDAFKVDVDGEWATVTRLDGDAGWGQNLILYARNVPNWSSDVDIAYGPEDDHIFTVGEKVKFTMAVLPQNHYPGAITQVLCYIGPKGGSKQIYTLYNGVPGQSPKAFMKDIEYTVPAFPNNLPKNDGFVLEVGYHSDMQYNIDDAKKNFQRTNTGAVLDYLPVAVPNGRKDSFKCDLLEKFPARAISNEPLSLDISYREQDHYQTAITQMFIYFKDESGGVDIVKLTNSVPGADPPTKRGGVTYLVPDGMEGKKIEVGAYFGLEYKFEDAVKQFENNGKNGSKVFGSFTIVSSEHRDASRIRKDNKVGFQNNNNNQVQLQRFLENDMSSKYYEALKRAGQAAANKVAQKYLKYGARKAVAAAADAATLNVVKTGISRGVAKRGAVIASQTFAREAAGGFAMGVKAVKGASTLGRGAFAVTLVGEIAGDWGGGKIGEWIGGETGEEVGSELGALAGSMAVGAALGSVVPGVGTAAGAVAGAVSYGIGKAIEGIFSLF